MNLENWSYKDFISLSENKLFPADIKFLVQTMSVLPIAWTKQKKKKGNSILKLDLFLSISS